MECLQVTFLNLEAEQEQTNPDSVIQHHTICLRIEVLLCRNNRQFLNLLVCNLLSSFSSCIHVIPFIGYNLFIKLYPKFGIC